MKKLLIPVIVAVLAGVGGGSGFAYMGASKAHVADSTQRADSLEKHPPASPDAAKHDSASHEPTAPDVIDVDSAEHAPGAHETDTPITPADSARAAVASRTPLHAATKGVPDAPPVAAAPAVTPVQGAPAHDAPTHDAPAKAGVAPSKASANTATAANIVRDARNDAIATSLPEQRLAKIFAAMSAKDAAKVLEQMPDADVRSILSLMSDRSAAAVLAQLGAARAATITKGSTRTPGATP